MSSNSACGNLGQQCWAHRDTTFDWRPLPLSQFDDEAILSTTVVAPYSDIMSTDLDAARARGAKILMWHGGARILDKTGTRNDVELALYAERLERQSN